jgi:hypothetical protein
MGNYRLILAFFVFTFACKENSPKSFAESPSANGKELSEMYCAACHKFPEPSLLDKDTWRNYILPRMGYMYGIYDSVEEREALFEKNIGGELVRNSNLFPAEPSLDSLHWKAIKEYYLSNAPEALSLPKTEAIAQTLNQFKVRIPNQKVKVPSSTMAQFSTNGSIYLGDALTKSFSVFDSNLRLLQSGTLDEGAVSIRDDKKAFWLTIMGGFSPSDAPKGSIVVLSKLSGKVIVPIKKLQRPVHSSYGDLDGDGDEDIVVCEFGKWTGALSLFLKNEDQYEKKVLLPMPGAIKAYLEDMDADGDLDIVALFAQGDEGIDIYFNDGNANFKRNRVLRFSPSMGSSHFKLLDYNKDGYFDILFTAGDNADYKPVLKPWHGVYVFINAGDNTFKKTLFLHLNGAYNAVAHDFDGDGDVDIAAISFFPDWVHTPEESFVYFENNKESYTRKTFPEVNKGRWIVMDAADYDSDGDIDLILGSLAFEVIPKLGFVDQWLKDGIPFLVLENKNR